MSAQFNYANGYKSVLTFHNYCSSITPTIVCNPYQYGRVVHIYAAIVEYL